MGEIIATILHNPECPYDILEFITISPDKYDPLLKYQDYVNMGFVKMKDSAGYRDYLRRITNEENSDGI